MLDKWIDKLTKPIDNASIVVFRIAIGILVPLELLHYYFMRSDLRSFYFETNWHFKHAAFAWLPHLNAAQMHGLLFLVILAFLFTAAGFLYRFSTIIAWLGYSFLFLSERANFLNHWYLICLLSFLLIFIPANKRFSVDAKLNKKIRSNTIPAWTLYALLLQISLVYIFAGIAKINPDWLAGQPMGVILENRTHKFPEYISQLFSKNGFVYLVSYGVILFELLIVPALLNRKTRLIVYCVSIVFHLLNSHLFTIGLFPHMMILMTTLFFPPDWKTKLFKRKKETKKKQVVSESYSIKKPLLYGLGFFFLIQCTLPFRPFLYKGNQLWSEQMTAFSWHMMTEFKDGNIKYLVQYNDQIEMDTIRPHQYDLSRGQTHKLVRSADLILQYAHHIGDRYEAEGKTNIKVYADAFLFLNGRSMQRYIHPNVDLLQQKKQLIKPYRWVMPLEEKAGLH